MAFNLFATDGTRKYRFKTYLFFIWKGRGVQIPMSEATMRRQPNREQLL